ncbi:putative bifunctional diguanylate cyclase/phosphodiesterase [uncultured Enterovirga sp.]|uniref:putative bifunctional diguanylate cyclase/phosphodiesterase n=1 Tax=uncultured Enterovirga sp. TaxID=2026352 RepID=UPI0035C95387
MKTRASKGEPEMASSSAPELEKESSRVRDRKLSVIAKIVPVSVLINALNGVFVSYLFWNYGHNTALLIWCGTNLLYCGSMLLDPRLLRWTVETKTPWLYRSILFRAPILGVIWGSLPWIVWPTHTHGDALLVGIIVNGMIAGGMMRLSVFPQAAITFGSVAAMLVTGAAFKASVQTGIAALVLETSFIVFMGKHITSHVDTIVESWSSTEAAAQAAVEQRLRDPLTGLPNRFACNQRLEAMLGEAKPVSILLLDLDRFKDVNDAHGHAFGDYYLQSLSRRLSNLIGSRGTLCRTDGDSFVVLVPSKEAVEVLDLAQLCVEASKETLQIGNIVISGELSVGVVFASGQPPDALIPEAELALSEAKAAGRRQIAVFEPRMRKQAQEWRALQAELSRAVEQGEFRLVYQPQVDLQSNQLVGCEALLRWQHPDKGLLAPGAFIDGLADDLAERVGWWVLDEACRQFGAWRDDGLDVGQIGVNLFETQFRSGQLGARVRDALLRHRLPPNALELEITETITLHHHDAALAPLRSLRAAGVKIAFDDFGTGFASLSMVKRFPLTRLKVDRSFVRDLGLDLHDDAIVRAVLAMARALNLDVVAEGIESEGQAERLVGLGCPIGQGFLFGPGLPPTDFTRRYGRAQIRDAA